MPTEITFSIAAHGTIDDEELLRLSDSLREDLTDAGVESVERLRGAEAAAGSKGDAVTLAGLLITLAPPALTGLIAMMQSWLTRHERTSLTLQNGDQKITVTGSLSREQQQVIADWLKAGKAP